MTTRRFGDIDLVRAFSEAEGPWITTFRRSSIKAIAKMTVDENLLERWVKDVAEFQGEDDDYCRQFLTIDAARSLQLLCQHAREHDLELFVCFYG